MKKKEER